MSRQWLKLWLIHLHCYAGSGAGWRLAELDDLADGDELVAAGLQAIEHGRHGIDCSFVDVVGEDDCALFSLAEDTVGDGDGITVLPVTWIERPHDCRVAEVGLDPLFLTRCDCAIGWTHGGWCLAGGLDDHIVGALQLRAHGSIRDLGKEWV